MFWAREKQETETRVGLNEKVQSISKLTPDNSQNFDFKFNMIYNWSKLNQGLVVVVVLLF